MIPINLERNQRFFTPGRSQAGRPAGRLFTAPAGRPAGRYRPACQNPRPAGRRPFEAGRPAARPPAGRQNHRPAGRRPAKSQPPAGRWKAGRPAGRRSVSIFGLFPNTRIYCRMALFILDQHHHLDQRKIMPPRRNMISVKWLVLMLPWDMTNLVIFIFVYSKINKMDQWYQLVKCYIPYICLKLSSHVADIECLAINEKSSLNKEYCIQLDRWHRATPRGMRYGALHRAALRLTARWLASDLKTATFSFGISWRRRCRALHPSVAH